MSREAEQALSLSIFPQDPSDTDFANWQKRIAHARKHYPDLVPKVPASAREARALAKELGIKPPPGMLYRDLPLAVVDTPDYIDHFDVFARKLVLAQHYRCFKKPLSRTGAMFAMATTNARMGDGEWFEDIVRQPPQAEIGRHGNEDLGDQILTRWHASADGNLAIFATHIQATLFILGLTGESKLWRQHLLSQGDLSGPFVW